MDYVYDVGICPAAFVAWQDQPIQVKLPPLIGEIVFVNHRGYDIPMKIIACNQDGSFEAEPINMVIEGI